MKPEDNALGADRAAQKAPETRQYATRVEVEEGLRALTGQDHAKLMIIARFFCRDRHLPSSAIEPQDLLSEAVLKTLECEEGKRWNKEVTLLKHLDRAMENISGHLVKERSKIVPFSDGLRPDEDELQVSDCENAETEAEELASKLKAVFGEDSQSSQVFRMRMEQLRPNQIQVKLGISAKEYETINRRILRKISLFENKPKV